MEHTDTEIQTILNRLREEIVVDRNALEIGEETQARLHLEIGDLRVEAKARVREIENSLKFLRADLEEDIRKNPAKYGIMEKVTVGSLDSAILRVPEYRKLEADLLEAQRESDHFQILLSTVEERKSTLKDLVSLYIYNYYSANNHSDESVSFKKLADERLLQYKELKHRRAEDEQGNDETN